MVASGGHRRPRAGEQMVVMEMEMETEAYHIMVIRHIVKAVVPVQLKARLQRGTILATTIIVVQAPSHM